MEPRSSCIFFENCTAHEAQLPLGESPGVHRQGAMFTFFQELGKHGTQLASVA